MKTSVYFFSVAAERSDLDGRMQIDLLWSGTITGSAAKPHTRRLHCRVARQNRTR